MDKPTKKPTPKKNYQISIMGKKIESGKIPIFWESPDTFWEYLKKNKINVEKDIQPVNLRVVFFGTSSFARSILEFLLGKKYIIVKVITQPDQRNKNKQTTPCSIKKFCDNHDLEVEQPEKLDDTFLKKIKNISPDLIIVADYGKILSKNILEIPNFGSLNIHASLLPKYRGPSPIQNSLINGDKKTGATIILMNEKVDAGDIIEQEAIEIDDNDNAKSLRMKLAILAATLLLKTIPKWVEGNIKAKPQNNKKATYCQLIEREDGHIIWNDKAENIYNKFRALYPWPGSFFFWKREDTLTRIKLHKISFLKENPQTKHPLGKIFEIGPGIGIQTGEGIILIQEIQLEGKQKILVKKFLNGYPDFIGAKVI